MRLVQVWKSKVGLWPRMALAISLGFFGLFIAFALLGERALQDSTDKLIEGRLAITQLVADQIDSLLDRAIFELEQANILIELNAEGVPFLQEAESFVQSYKRVGHFSSGIILLDAQGQVILSDPPDLYSPGVDLAMLPYISDVLEGGEPTIADPFIHPLDAQPVTAVTVPLIHNGQLVGLLTGLINLKSESISLPLARAVVIGKTEHANLVDAEGRSIASTLEVPFLSSAEHSGYYRDAMVAGEPKVDVVTFELDLPTEPEGHFHVMAIVPLKNANWGVSVGGDAIGDTFSGVQRLRRGLIVLGVLSLFSIWIITLLGTRRLVQPVQELTQAAHKIADGDLTTPLVATDGGEIGVLAVALNKMRTQMLQNISNLSKWNEELELRVADKMDDLRQQQQLTQRLLQQVITAQESERGRIAYELHDEIGQMLAAVEMSISHLADAIPSDDEILNTRLTRTHQLIEKTVIDLRHIISALRPTVLDQLGLVPALSWICDQTLVPLGIDVTLQTPKLGMVLLKEVETILFRIAQEAINNIVRHSQATYVIIKLEESKTGIVLRVEDNGKGFDLKVINAMPIVGRRLGLADIQERAALIEGEVAISSNVGEGTAVTVSIPLSKQSAQGETDAISIN